MSISTLQEGRYIDVNAALLAQAGYSREEMIGRTARELGVYVDAADFAGARLLTEKGVVKNLEMTVRGKHARAPSCSTPTCWSWGRNNAC